MGDYFVIRMVDAPDLPKMVVYKGLTHLREDSVDQHLGEFVLVDAVENLRINGVSVFIFCIILCLHEDILVHCEPELVLQFQLHQESKLRTLIKYLIIIKQN